jgi:hypothetical protein
MAGGAYGPVHPIPFALGMCSPPVDVDHALELAREFDAHGPAPPLEALAWADFPSDWVQCRRPHCFPVVLLTAKAANKLQASPHIFRYDKRFI